MVNSLLQMAVHFIIMVLSHCGCVFLSYVSDVPSVTAVVPSSGPITGDTTVTVKGSQFVFTGEITVRFGSDIVDGTFVDSEHISCVSTPHAVNGTVPVTVALNGQQFTSSNASFLFYSMCFLMFYCIVI